MTQLFLQLDPSTLLRIFEIWTGFIPSGCTLVAVSVLGDLFLKDPSGIILHLDILEGRVVPVAESESQWRELLNDSSRINEWFLPGFLESLQRKGIQLKADECYGWTIHPRIGGKAETNNLSPINLVAYHIVINGLFRMSPGNKIDRFSVDGIIP